MMLTFLLTGYSGRVSGSGKPPRFLIGDGQASCPAGRVLALRGSRCWPTTSRWGRWGAERYELSCSRYSRSTPVRPSTREGVGEGGRSEHSCAATVM